MRIEKVAAIIADLLTEDGYDVPYEPEDEMRSGGQFFTVVVDGRYYDVTVVEQ